MMRVLAWMAAGLLGLVLGAASAWVALDLGRGRFFETAGAWHWSRAAGARAADPYTRAIIARDGLLALSAREALYFTLDRDEHGRKLSEGCIYDIEGLTPRARWWSLTLYAPDNYLARNSDHAASVDATRMAVDGRGAWRARISPVRGEASNWISSRAARRGFSLMLRVYNPSSEFVADEADLPRLTTVSCPEAGA